MKNKLTTCKSCGADIAKSASKCPHCSAYRPPIARSPLSVGIICVALVFFMLYLITLDFSGEKKEVGDTIIEVSVSDLLSSYQENEINADNSYKGELLAVVGAVSSISTYLNKPCIIIDSNEQRPGLVCLFSEGDASKELTSLRVGDMASIQGYCSGTNADGTVVIAQTPGYLSQYVYLNSCEIINAG